MKSIDHRNVLDRIEQEGFEYAFIHYSDFKEVNDDEFHRLRKAYEAAHHALADYIGYPEE